jgi:uncharacterized Zn finger protein (UPF0148 family)
MSAFIASRTPEGMSGHCPACGEAVCLEPSWPSGDAPCPRCGNLVWFENRVEAIEVPDALRPNSTTNRLLDRAWGVAHPEQVEHWEEMRRTERAKRLRRRRRLRQGVWPGRVTETFSRLNSWVRLALVWWVRSALVRLDFWAGSPAYGAVWDPWLDS